MELKNEANIRLNLTSNKAVKEKKMKEQLFN